MSYRHFAAHPVRPRLCWVNIASMNSIGVVFMLLALPTIACGKSEIVIAICYLQPDGLSRAQLSLFRRTFHSE